MDALLGQGVLHDLFHSQLGEEQWNSLFATLKLSPIHCNQAFEQRELQRVVFILLIHAATLVRPLAKISADERYLELCKQWNTFVEHTAHPKQVEEVQQLAQKCWQYLPVELLSYVFTFLKGKSQKVVMTVNKRWRETRCRMITRLTFKEQERFDTFKWDLFNNVNSICFDSRIENLCLTSVPSGRVQEIDLSSARTVENYEHLSVQKLIVGERQSSDEIKKLLCAFSQVEALELRDLNEDGAARELGRQVCQMRGLTQLALIDTGIDIITGSSYPHIEWPSESEATNLTSLTSLSLKTPTFVENQMMRVWSNVTDLDIRGDKVWMAAELKQLKRLHISSEEMFQEFDMEVVMHNTNLTELSVERSLCYDPQNAPFPETISRLMNLTVLNLDGNYFFEISSTLQALSRLTHLQMNRNELDELKGEWLPQSLHTVELSNNNIEWIDESFGQRMTNLTKLRINENRLTHIYHLPTSLTYLSASAQGMKSIEEITQLQELRRGEFRDNRIKKLPNLEGNTKLRVLDVRYNHFYDLSEYKSQPWLLIRKERTRPTRPLRSSFSESKGF